MNKPILHVTITPTKSKLDITAMKEFIECVKNLLPDYDIITTPDNIKMDVKDILNAIKEKTDEMDNNIKNCKTCNVDYSNGVKDGMRYVSTFFCPESEGN